MKKFLGVVLLVLLLAGCAGVEPAPTEPSETVFTAPETVAITEPPTEPATQAPTEPPAEVPEETEDPNLMEVLPAPEPEDRDLVLVTEYISIARVELAYATEENFTGQVIYDFHDAYLRYGTVKKLMSVCQELAEQGLGILIWDGFRPVYAQAALWEVCPNRRYVSHPVTGTRAHCRGSAIDLTLVDLESGEKLRMPTGFDDFSALADRNYSDCDPEAAANAKILENAMKRQGFIPYSGEWWHFSDPVSYPVEENFMPPVG